MRLGLRKIIAPLLLLVASAAQAQLWGGPAAVEIRVEDQKGPPVAGATLTLRYNDVDPKDGPDPVLTDSHGKATVGGLAEGSWHLEVSHEGFMTYLAEITVARRAGSCWRKPRSSTSSGPLARCGSRSPAARRDRFHGRPSWLREYPHRRRCLHRPPYRAAGSSARNPPARLRLRRRRPQLRRRSPRRRLLLRPRLLSDTGAGSRARTARGKTGHGSSACASSTACRGAHRATAGESSRAGTSC